MTARALPVEPTFTAGQELTSSELNQMVTYSLFWANRPCFRMYQTVSTSVPTAANTQVPMDTSMWDSDSGRQGATPWNYVVPFAGRWKFTAQVVYAGNATGARQTMIFQNGSPSQGFGCVPNAGGTVTVGALTSVEIVCSAGDTIGVWTWQNSGGPLGTNVGASNQVSFFEGELISLANP